MTADNPTVQNEPSVYTHLSDYRESLWASANSSACTPSLGSSGKAVSVFLS